MEKIAEDFDEHGALVTFKELNGLKTVWYEALKDDGEPETADISSRD